MARRERARRSRTRRPRRPVRRACLRAGCRISCASARALRTERPSHFLCQPLLDPRPDRSHLLVRERALGAPGTRAAARATSCPRRPARRGRGRTPRRCAARASRPRARRRCTVWASTASSTTTAMSCLDRRIGDQVHDSGARPSRRPRARRRGRSRTRRRWSSSSRPKARATTGAPRRANRPRARDQDLGGTAGMQEGRPAVRQPPVDAERLEHAREQPLHDVEVRSAWPPSATSSAVSSPASTTPRCSCSSGSMLRTVGEEHPPGLEQPQVDDVARHVVLRASEQPGQRASCASPTAPRSAGW